MMLLNEVNHAYAPVLTAFTFFYFQTKLTFLTNFDRENIIATTEQKIALLI